MLKLMANVTRPDGKPGKLIAFGLSETNLERLKAGNPIVFDGAAIDLVGFEFLIFAGKDESSMYAEFRELINAQTKVTIGPKVDLSP